MCLSSISAFGEAIVNIEDLRREGEVGFFANISANLNASRGNSDRDFYSAQLRFDNNSKDTFNGDIADGNNRVVIYDFETKKRDQENKNIESSKSEIGWGHQIRSYVLHPYRQVKDTRTQVESSNPDNVLDGDIDIFLEAALTKAI